MENDIVQKLRQQLSSPVTTECKVVYVLCQARKLLDKNPPIPSLFTLRLYCNWALHVDLDRDGTTRSFLQSIDEFVFNSVDPSGKEDLVEEHKLFIELFYLDRFRAELKSFLDSYNLP